MKDKAEILDMINRYTEGACTPEERGLLETWYLNQEELDHLELTEQKIREDLAYITGNLPQPARSIHKKIGPVKWISVAATLLFAISAITILFTSRYSPLQTSGIAQDIPAPKGNKATLTLPNGKVITLNDAKTGVIIDASKLTYNDGSKIENPAIGDRLNTKYSLQNTIILTTPRGGQYQITLPDGTMVNMNTASVLKFPSSFAALKERRVELQGEAYFSVQHNSKKPFRVISKGQMVEDIGTEFNINAYTDEPTIKTTLIEGSAKVSTQYPPSGVTGGGLPLTRTREVTLKPNQQAVIVNNVLTTQTVNPDEILAWQKGYFQFDQRNLETIMREVSRWYNVDIIYKDQKLRNLYFVGTVSKYKNVSQVLKKLEMTGAVRFEIAGRTITVSK